MNQHQPHDFRTDHTVALEQIEPVYPAVAPYHPSEPYPEYDGPTDVAAPNHVYAGVRQLFVDLGYDAEHVGTALWNPLSALIRPGQRVLLKPNLVMHRNHSGHTTECLITHGSIVRVVADYALRALQGSGELIIGDAPTQHCDFETAIELSGIRQVYEYLAQTSTTVPVRLVDFRVPDHSLTKKRSQTYLDPLGFSFVDLGTASAHHGARAFDALRVTNYDPSLMLRHHNAEKHEYAISNSALLSDVVISLPKLKTHRLAGITCSLKNFVGINNRKDCLPHHTRGSQDEGGDEYQRKNHLKYLVTTVQEFEDLRTSRFVRTLVKVPKKLLYLFTRRFSSEKYFEGSWWGNDTIWRTTLDINRIFFFWNTRAKRLESSPQRVYLSIVDGVVAGDHDGPLAPEPIAAGILLAGTNPIAVDTVAARAMGFDWQRIPSLVRGRTYFASFELPTIAVASSITRFAGRLVADTKTIVARFVPSKGWRGHIELPL